MIKTIYLAAGCFWGTQEFFRRLKGTDAPRVGYANGTLANPTYKEVKAQVSGHAETCEVLYNTEEISLEKVLDYYFKIIDPTELNHQGEDFGTSYRTGIYTVDEETLAYAKDYVNRRQADYDKPIVVEVCPLNVFYDAEEYHQNYLVNNPTGYCHIHFDIIAKQDLK